MLDANGLEKTANGPGFTKAITAEGGDYVLDLWVRPETDFDGTFVAYCRDTGECLRVNGWLFSIEENLP